MPESAQQRWVRLHPERVREIKAKWRRSAKGQKAAKDGHLLYAYKMTRAQRDEKIVHQNHRCAICNQKFSKKNPPCIDHSHDCCAGVRSCGSCLRDILCFRCNTVLDRVKDNATILSEMISYLARWWRTHGIQNNPS